VDAEAGAFGDFAGAAVAEVLRQGFYTAGRHLHSIYADIACEDEACAFPEIGFGFEAVAIFEIGLQEIDKPTRAVLVKLD
jgi:hypothetical protein